METELTESSEPPPESAAFGQEAGAGPPALGLAWVLLLFFAFRALTLLLLRPGGFIRDWSDFDTFLGFASLSDYGLYPFVHYWLEWPPAVPWLAVGAYRLSLLFPAWPDDYRLWFVLILGGIFVLFEAGNLALVYRISLRLVRAQPAAWGPRETQAMRPVWLYALLFVPLYTMLGFFDSIALFFLLLALDLTLNDRLMGSAIALGAGFIVKLTPILFLPVALRQLWDAADGRRAGLRDGALYAVTTALSILALTLPFILSQPVWLLTMVRAVAGRSAWETVWAAMDGYYGFGVVAGDRLNPAETAFAVHPSALPWWAISLAFALIYVIVLLQKADYRQPRHLVALTGLTVALFLLCSKGYSPQFLVYLLPFIVLLFPNGRGVAYCLLLTLLNVLEQPVYFVLAPDAHQLLLGIVVARWLVLGALAMEFASVTWGASLHRLAGLRRYAPAALALLIFFGLLVGFPSLARSYSGRRLQQEPAAALIGYLGTGQARAQAGLLVVSDPSLLRRFQPYLGGDYIIRAAGGDNLPQGAPNLALRDALTLGESLWFVPEPSGNNRGRPAADLGSDLLNYDFGAGYRLQLLARRAALAPLPPVTRLANGADLIGYQLARPSRQLVQVTLYWWTSAPASQSYTVFTQVLGSEGRFVAGHDSFPANGKAPTHTWQPGRVVADPHAIELPPDMVAGNYQIVAGMYDVNSRRVLASRPDGGAFKDSAVPLGEMQLP